MKIVVDGAGKILMWSEHASPAAEPGCKVIELSALQEAAFRAAQKVPNSGLVFVAGIFAKAP